MNVAAVCTTHTCVSTHWHADVHINPVAFGAFDVPEFKRDIVTRLLLAKKASKMTFSQIAAKLGLTNVYTAQLFYRQVSLNQMCRVWRDAIDFVAFVRSAWTFDDGTMCVKGCAGQSLVLKWVEGWESLAWRVEGMASRVAVPFIR